MSIHSTAAEARDALRPEAPSPIEAEVAPDGATADVDALQPPVAVNQVLTPDVEALLSELALQLPAVGAVTAEVERELTQFAAEVVKPVTPAATPVTPVAAFDEERSRLEARIYGLDPVRNTQAELVALIREHRLPVSPACGGRASRTKRTIIDELRQHVGQEPLPVRTHGYARSTTRESAACESRGGTTSAAAVARAAAASAGSGTRAPARQPAACATNPRFRSTVE